MKVLFVVSELNPLIKTGGLADVAGALPKHLHQQGIEVRIALPDYQVLDKKELKYAHNPAMLKITTPHEKIDCLVSQVSHPDLPNQLYLFKTGRGLQLPEVYPGPQDKEQDRFLIFNLGVIEWLKSSDWQPDIVHCHDWMTGVIPQLIKQNKLPAKSVLTIHNLAYQGVIPTVYFDDLGIKVHTVAPQSNMLRLGIQVADKLNTVSPTYASEVLTAEYGFGLEKTLEKRKDDFTGILNGLDYDRYTPADNPHLHPAYDIENVTTAKRRNKQWLQQKLQLPTEPNQPLYGLIARLDDQKGLGLVEAAITSSPLLRHGQLIILGVGEAYWERRFRLLAEQHRNLMVVTQFDEPLAHQIYAASDFILVPSRYEPCGLTQLIAMKYGSIPIVRQTGGLADTVIDQRESTKTGTGIVFDEYSAIEFTQALGASVGLYNQTKVFQQIIKRAMTQDFSWPKSTLAYIDLYKQALNT